MLNREAIVRTRDAIAAAPDSHFNMRLWGNGKPSCGSAACLAGFVCFAHGISIGDKAPYIASKILSAKHADLSHLFWPVEGCAQTSGAHLSYPDFKHITRQDAIALCNMLIDAADGKRTVESCTWHAVIAARPHDAPKLPDSITDALNEPLDEQPDETFIAEMEAAK